MTFIAGIVIGGLICAYCVLGYAVVVATVNVMTEAWR
jgi:hypothetical protein